MPLSADGLRRGEVAVLRMTAKTGEPGGRSSGRLLTDGPDLGSGQLVLQFISP